VSLADTRVKADPADRPTSEWQRLRSLLLGAEQASLHALAAKVGNRDNLARSVASVLAEATAIRARQDDGITRVLAPIINDGLQQSVRENPQPVVDALYPIMGPAIRRSIAEALSDMMQTFNRAVEQSLSPRAVKWRLDAWRTGQPYAQVVLLNTLVYRVEQVFLIHRETGLLLGHVQAEHAVVQDPDMVSGMLTAIRDFVGDSFHVSQEDSVEAIRLGELSVQVRMGPKAVLAAVVRGNPPQSLRARLSETLERIHQSHAVALSRFDGDMAPFANVPRDLEPCLLAQARERIRRPWRAYVGLALLVAGSAWWLIERHESASEWSAILDQLDHEPGFMVVETGGDGAHLVRGLRDPIARDPQSVIGTERARAYGIVWDLKPYLSLEPPLVLARARLQLKPPEDVTFRLQGNTLRASGVAPEAWLREARRRAPLIAGITTFDDRAVEIKDREAFNRARQAINEATLYFEPASDAIADSQLAKLDAIAPNLIVLRDAAAAAQMGYSVDIVGRADAPGSSDFNLRLSQSRAETVRRYLLAHGAPAKMLHARGIGAIDAIGPQANEADDGQRRVNFEVIAVSAETADSAP
jgi:outer membrane protein OmpA-like peptidoglycan-associated protein